MVSVFEWGDTQFLNIFCFVTVATLETTMTIGCVYDFRKIWNILYFGGISMLPSKLAHCSWSKLFSKRWLHFLIAWDFNIRIHFYIHNSRPKEMMVKFLTVDVLQLIVWGEESMLPSKNTAWYIVCSLWGIVLFLSPQDRFLWSYTWNNFTLCWESLIVNEMWKWSHLVEEVRTILPM